MNFWSFEYSFDPDLKNRMLYGKIYGIWKVDTAKAYAEEMKEIVQPFKKKPWAKLMDLTNWKSSHPEVIEIIGDLNHWCRQNNMEWTVFIINQQVGFGQLMRMFDSGKYADIGKTFRTLKEGEDFLMSKGYNIRKDSSGIFK